MYRSTIVVYSIFIFFMAGSTTVLFAQADRPHADSPPAVPLPQAHAHNDYAHAGPLQEALDCGFCSVEADIFLVDGQLLVGHTRSELRPDRTLQHLYLDPLRQRTQHNSGRVYPGGPVFQLLIDIKSSGVETYRVLSTVLAAYADCLCVVENGRYQERAIQIVISGDCPRAAIEAQSPRWAAIDGRVSDLESTEPAHLMPLISDRWSAHFRWRGEGEFPATERSKLNAIVQRAHAAGRRVRFWATPESPVVWRELAAAGVDYLNTDQLEQLRDFLKSELRSSSE